MEDAKLDYLNNLSFEELQEVLKKEFEGELQDELYGKIRTLVNQMYSQVLGKEISFECCYSTSGILRYPYAVNCNSISKTISFYREGTIMFSIKYSSKVAGQSKSYYYSAKNIYKIRNIKIILYPATDEKANANFLSLVNYMENIVKDSKDNRKKDVDDMTNFLKEKGITYDKLKEIYDFFKSLNYYEKGHVELTLGYYKE